MKRKYDDPEERRKRQESRYIGMVRAVFKVCQRQAVPLYSSKYSRRDFTLWQHIALLALMQRMRKSYREYRNDFLTVTERLVRVLGLSKLPHFTTIEKFALRVSSTLHTCRTNLLPFYLEATEWGPVGFESAGRRNRVLEGIPMGFAQR
jgi:hypothetical protein